MYVEFNFRAIVTQEFVSLFIKRISRKISKVSFKIISLQNVNLSKVKEYSVFPAVNSSKRLVNGGWKGDYGGGRK
jgi:hypothetical protein